MKNFTVVLSTPHGNTERTIEADDGLLTDHGYLVLSTDGPTPDAPGETVAMFAPGSWSHFIIDEGV